MPAAYTSRANCRLTGVLFRLIKEKFRPTNVLLRFIRMARTSCWLALCEDPFSYAIVDYVLVRELNKEFKDKRKKHYNVYSQVKLARKLIE